MLLLKGSWKNSELFRPEEEKECFVKVYTSACEDTCNYLTKNCYHSLMKSLVLLLIIFSLQLTIQAQKSSDPLLKKRLLEYLKLEQRNNPQKQIEYLHPKMFLIRSKEDVLEEMQLAHDNELLRIVIDSTSIKNISPVFSYNGIQYAKAEYKIFAHFIFKEPIYLSTDENISKYKDLLQKDLRNGIVGFNKTHNWFTLETASSLMAIKDVSTSPWKVIWQETNQELLELLYPDPVLKHFDLLK